MLREELLRFYLRWRRNVGAVCGNRPNASSVGGSGFNVAILRFWSLLSLMDLIQSLRQSPSRAIRGRMVVILLTALVLSLVVAFVGISRIRARAARPRASQFATRVVENAMRAPFRTSGAEILSKPFAKRIIVSERHRFIYCPVPKVANSNWKYLIRKNEGFEDYDDLTKAHNANTSGLR